MSRIVVNCGGHIFSRISSLLREFNAVRQKYILRDYESDYRLRLLSLNMLPLMYWLDLQDLVFLVKCLKDPNDTFNIHHYITFVTSSTRAGTNNKLCHRFTRLNSTRHFYFVRIVRLWNTIPNGILDLNLTVQTNKLRLREYLWGHFALNFNPINPCTYHYLCACYKLVILLAVPSMVQSISASTSLFYSLFHYHPALRSL